MSRTFRRKNAWNAHYWIDDRVNDPKELDWLRGIHNYDRDYIPRGVGKYTGLTTEQIYNKLFYKYHSDGWYPKNPPGFKKVLNVALRARNKREFVDAMKRGLEDDLQLTNRRDIWRYVD